ncbi:polysaccharide pyruvyl transferase family protein [Ulvibacterium sp.]|uniref:polysaccharide pyruvyl transferase family protein n=1 Tax=Ulvibacterium sp. TaxID=2665914 RepID=UPI003BAD709C
MKNMEEHNYDRRNWLKLVALANTGILLPTPLLSCMDKASRQSQEEKVNTLLVISGWQEVNIGDIAHTPGLLHVLETFLPNAKVILWKRKRSEEVEKLLKRNFPKVEIVYGSVDNNYDVDNPEVYDAFKRSDLLVHGSGPSVVGRTSLQAWLKRTDKPFGIFGTTIQEIDDDLEQLLKKAAFIFTRETQSMGILKDHGIAGEHIAFAPDATFFIDIRDDNKANAFLREHGLEEQKFICAIPRLRYSPYHKIRKVDWSEEKIKKVETVNERHKEEDHAKLREAMIAWVRETGNKILVCPEMTYQVDIMDELLIDPLPEDVKPHVVKRGYWMPDEAASVYAKAHTILSFECHSPIISAANGTPMFYLRQPEDTIKGHMYYDLGFEQWVFEIEDTTGKQIADTLREVWTNYDAANAKLKTNMDKVQQIYKQRTDYIKKIYG